MKPAIKFEISWNQETNISHFKVQTDHRHRKLHPETVPSSFPFQKDLSDPHLLFPQKNIPSLANSDYGLTANRRHRRPCMFAQFMVSDVLCSLFLFLTMS